MAKLEYQGDFESNDVIRYAHSAAVTAWTPIFVSGIGVLVPMVSAAINVETTYYIQGRFLADIASAVSVSQFDPLYYDTDADKVQKTVPTNGGFIGYAVKAGTATAGYVELQLCGNVFSGMISKEQLDGSVQPSNIVVYEGSVAAGGTQTTESIAIAGCLTTDEAWVKVKTPGVDTTAFVKSCKISTAGTIAAILNTPTGAGASLSYRVDRAAS